MYRDLTCIIDDILLDGSNDTRDPTDNALDDPTDITLDPTDNTLDPTDVLDAERLDTPSTVVIEEFPFGSPGAPIPDKPQGTPAYASAASHQDVLADSIWAPFRSQHDWAIARWAKMCGSTSTAVTELLAIPEVWMLFICGTVSLTPRR
jgi:hypothetical protein